MATLVGKVGIVAKGNWSNSATYEALDCVSYSGGIYIAKQAVPAGTLPTNTTYWQAGLEIKSKEVTDTTSVVGNFDPGISANNIIVGVVATEYIGIAFKNSSNAWRCRFLDLTTIEYVKNTSITATIYYI